MSWDNPKWSRTDYSLIGQKIGYLTVLEYAGKTNDGVLTNWKCRCDCGNEVIVQRSNLIQAKKHGKNISCGCHRLDNVRTHNDSKSRLYRIYNGIKQRCYNPKEKNAQYYYFKGIKMCDEWLQSYENFRDWALMNGYQEDLSIDRIDPNGDYTPDNCRWANDLIQANNKTNNRTVSINGLSHTLAEWAIITNQIQSSLQYRFNINDYQDLIKHCFSMNEPTPYLVQDGNFYKTYEHDEIVKIVSPEPELIGMKFGRLTVIEDLGMQYSKSGKTKKHMVLCRCDCGKEKTVALNKAKSGHTSSCGCLRKETTRNTGKHNSKNVALN